MRGHWRSLALAVALVAVAVGRGATSRATADSNTASCASFQSIGAASPNAVEYGIPYEIFGGAPYVETEISSSPKARALSSALYPGQIGEILLGTAGLNYKDPTTKEVFWPAVQGGKSTDSTAVGGVAQDFATTGQGPQAMSWATFGGANPTPGFAFGPSYATSQTSAHDGVLSGQDESWSYNVQLGAVSFFSIHSLVTYRTDGSDKGTTGNWLLELSGIHNGSSRVVSAGNDGISIEGGSPQPGPSFGEQTGAAISQLSALLQSAGVGKLNVSLKPGKVITSAGKADIQGASLEVRLEPKPTAGQIGQSVSVLFGYENRTVTMNNVDCADSGTSPDSSTGTGVTPAPAATSSGSSSSSAGLDAGTPAGSTSLASPALAPASPSSPSSAPSRPTRLAKAVPLTGAAALWGRRAYDWLLVVMLAAAGGLAALFGLIRFVVSRP